MASRVTLLFMIILLWPYHSLCACMCVRAYMCDPISSNDCKFQVPTRHISHCVGGSKGKSSISDVSPKRGIHLDVSWENDPFDLYFNRKTIF